MINNVDCNTSGFESIGDFGLFKESFDQAALLDFLKPSQLDYIYKKYCIIHQSYHADPHYFSVTYCTREFTAIFGGRYFSWRVVGITKLAFDIFSESNFEHPIKWAEKNKKETSKYKIQRAHLVSRLNTTKLLLQSKLILDPAELWIFWMKKDVTILCGPGENKKIMNAAWQCIDNPMAKYFPSDFVSFKFRRDIEGALLRNLARSNC